MNVTIDTREQKRIKEAQDYYTQQGCNVEIKELEIGDYIFTDNNNQVVFEFKTIPDFITSINDNRVFNEAINQIENFDYHYVIIQGDEHTRAKALKMTQQYQEVTYFQYLGAIASLNRYTTVIESYSPFIHEAYYRMLITARKCLQNKPIIRKFQKKHRNSALNYLCHDIYGVNYKRAKDITELLELKNLEDLLNITHQQLTSVNGIGDKLADKILKQINNDTI